MEIVKQDDYEKFKCIAGACPKSCCEVWEICIDEDSIEKYRNVKGKFKSRIEKSIDFNEEIFLQKDRKCLMLNEDGYCDLQINLGEDNLCYTCKMYPRHVEEYENLRELSLSLSCPETARMLVERNKKISFVEEENDDDDDFEDFDYFTFTKLEDIRSLFYKIVKDDNIPLINKINIIFELSNEIQTSLDEYELYKIDEILEIWDKNYKENSLDKKYSSQIIAKRDISNLYNLELLEDDWIENVDKAYSYTKNVDIDDILDKLNLEEKFIFENMLCEMIYVYFCGAVYDFNVISKAGMCINFCIWVFLIYKSQKEIQAGPLEKQVLIKVLYEFSREVEHSDLNLDFIEGLFL